MILINESGGVEQRNIEMGVDLSEEFLANLRTQLNQQIAGERYLDIAERLLPLVESCPLADREIVESVNAALIEMAIQRSDERVVLAGTANLARFREDFSAEIHPVLEALEEQVVLLRLLGDVGNSVQVRIGQEQSEQNLRQTSMVTVGYGIESAPLAALGIIGPTRMDYAGSIAAVSAVARYVGRYMNEGL